MKIPKYIEKSIRIAGKHDAIANRHNEIVRIWLEKRGIHAESGDIEALIIMDMLIDSLEYGLNQSKEFIEYLKQYHHIAKRKYKKER